MCVDFAAWFFFLLNESANMLRFVCACACFSFRLRSVSSYLKTKVLVSAIRGMDGAIFHFQFSFKDFFKSIILLQLYGGRQWKGGDELKVMFADVLGRTVNRNLGVKFHLLNYFLGLIFFFFF